MRGSTVETALSIQCINFSKSGSLICHGLQAIKIMKEEVCEKLADPARKVETLLILIQEDE